GAAVHGADTGSAWQACFPRQSRPAALRRAPPSCGTFPRRPPLATPCASNRLSLTPPVFLTRHYGGLARSTYEVRHRAGARIAITPQAVGPPPPARPRPKRYRIPLTGKGFLR